MMSIEVILICEVVLVFLRSERLGTTGEALEGQAVIAACFALELHRQNERSLY